MKLKFTFFLSLMILSVAGVQAQTMLPLPTQTGPFSGNVRGYWFTAPTDFTIVAVEAPTTASTGDQNIAVLKMAAAPPAFPTLSNAFTTEALFQNNTTAGQIAVNIQYQTGEVVGILGNRADVNSYGAGQFATTLGGLPVTLTRMGMQFNLSNTAPQDIWQEATGSISRVNIWYTTCSAPTPQLMTIGNVGCNGDSTGTATMGAVGGMAPYSYVWSTGDSTAATGGLAAGTYTVSIYDDVACLADTMIVITEPDTMSAAFTLTHNPCFGDANGSATVTPMGAVMPYNYNWSSGGSASVETGLLAGVHTVTVTDDNNCDYEFETLITEPAELVTTIDSVTFVTCEGDDDGMIISTTSGGVVPYTLLWDDGAGQGSATAINLEEGLYTVMATDGNGCVTTASATVDHIFPAPAIDLGPDIAANAPFYDISAPAGFSSYDWSTGATGTLVRVFDAGTYTVVITDDNGCSNSDEIVISKVWASGIEHLEEGASVNVFPNPTEGILNVQLDGWTSEDLRVEVSTLTGQVVLSQNTNNMPSAYLTAVDMGSLSAGTYLLRLTSNHNTVVRKVQLK